MNTQQEVEVPIALDEVAVGPILVEPEDPKLKAERVQLVLRITEQGLADPGAGTTYVYELSVDRYQTVTIELPSITVTLHGDSVATAASGSPE